MSAAPDNRFEPNPYVAPRQSPFAPGSPQAARAGLPTFVLIVLIIDLALLALRALIVVFGIVGLAAMPNDPLIAQTGIFEIASGAAIVFLGFVANVAMLCKQAWGALVGWLKIAAVAASFAVGIWQLSFMLQAAAPGTPEYVGMIFGAVMMMILRGSIVVLYAVALIVFSRWVHTSQLADTANMWQARPEL